MKTNRCCCTLLSMLAVFSGTHRADAIVSPKAMFSRMVSVIDKVEEQGGQVLFSKIDYVSRGGSNTLSLTLKDKNKYLIFAVGDDERVKDVDLLVKDESDYEIGKDDDEKNLALVKVSPKWAGKFFLTVSPAEMVGEAKDAFFGVIVARVGEDPVSTETIATRVGECLVTAEAKSRQVLYAQLDTVDRGGPASVTYDLEADTKYMVVAVGDGNRVTDLDMKVEDEEGRELGADGYQSNEASVTFIPRRDGKIRFVVEAASIKKGFSDAFYGLVIMRLPSR